MRKIYKYLPLLLVWVMMTCTLAVKAQITGTTANSIYTEHAAAITIHPNFTLGGTSAGYGGGYLLFDLTNGSAGDILTIKSDANPNAVGAISISGTGVFLGNGTGTSIIGSIDGVLNGQNGQKLKINFTSNFANPSFEQGVTGWTVLNQQVFLGTTQLFGFTMPSDPTNPSNTSAGDTHVPASFTFSNEFSTTEKTSGNQSLRLFSSMTTQAGCDVVHGPVAYSDPFSANAGDVLSFDWRALGGGDAYDVFCYIVNTSTGAATIALNQTGQDASAATPWATANVTVPANGNYRFVFVSGTWDQTCGRAAGASLYVDNVKVVGNNIDINTISALAKHVTYQNNCGTSAATRNLTVSAVKADNTTVSASSTITLSTFAPVPHILSNFAVNLGTNGQATVIPSSLDNGSTDDCSIVFTLSKSTFTCADLGANNVVVTLKDPYGNTSTANTVITVSDVNAPVLTGVPANTTAQCSSIPAMANVTVSDNCTLNGALNAYQFPSATVRSSLVHNYTFSSGATDSKGTANGTLNGGVSFVPGISGTAASFNGVNSYIDMGTAASLNGSGDFAISVWIKTASAAGQTIIQQRAAGINGQYILNVGANHAGSIAYPGQVYFMIYNTTFQFEIVSANRVDDNQWHHIVAERKGTNGNIYVDGVLQGTGSGPLQALDSNIPTFIGRDMRDVSKTFNGLIDELKIYGPASCPSNYDIERTWWAKDVSGNYSLGQQIITVQDTQAPVLSAAPADATVECDAVPAAATLTATDNCDGAPAVTFAEVRTNGNCTNNYTLTRTWTAKDACGNTSTKTQVLTVRDTKAPVLSAAPADVTVQCNAIPAAATLTATDNCSGSRPVNFSEVRTNGSCSGNYILTRTWTSADVCGNTATKTQVITVQDTQAPVLSAAPANTTVECDAVPAAATLTATDNCDAAPVVTFAEVRVNGNCANNYTLTRTWTAKDACGNTSTRTQTITVQDTKAPLLVGVPANATVACNAVPAPASVTATDNCDAVAPAVSYSETRTNGSSINNYTLTRTWTATDACGNNATKTQVITVQDTQAPTVLTKNITVVLNASGSASITAQQVDNGSTDNCGGTISFSVNRSTFNCADVSASPVPVILTVTDASGNFATATAFVSVIDQINPAISSPANINHAVDAGQCTYSFTPATPAASDNCGMVVVTGVRNDGLALDAPYPTGTTVITWTATDNSGLTATTTQTVTVTAPEINLTGNGVSIVKGDATPSASDNTDMGSTITGTPVSKMFTIQNTGAASLTVSSINVSGTNAADFSVSGISFPATIAANGTANFTVTFNAATAGVKNATITVNNTDCNEASYDFAVKGQTTCIAPSFSNINVYIQQSTSAASCTAVVNYPLSVSGTPAPGVTYTFTGATTGTGNGTGSGQAFNQGITHVLVSATNACGTQTAGFDVTVVDDVKPTVVSKNITIYLDQTGHATFNAADLDGGSYDNCGAVTVGLNQGTICGTAAEGSSVTLTAPAGVNISGIQFASYGTPNGTCGNFTLGSCNASNSMSIVSALAIGRNTVTIPATNGQFGDPCGGTVKRLYIQASYGYGGTGNTGDFTCANLGANTVTFLVSDAAGNVSTGTAIVTVVDRQGPAITAPNITRTATNAAQCGTNVSFAATATDCTPGTITYSYSKASGSFFNIGITPVTVTATDPLGNASTATFNVIVTDGAGPIITAPADIILNNAAGVCGSTATFAATATDCSGVSSITYDKQPGSYLFPVGINTVTVTARDILGNVSTATFRVTVNDREVPVITQPASISVNNDAGKCGAMVSVAAPIASDNCGGVLSKVGVRSDALALNALYPVGTTTITWTVTDTHNNVSVATQTVTVTDNEKPVLVGVPANTTADCDAVPVPATVSATDNCSTSVPVMTETRTEGDCPSNYTLTRTWTTTDASSNITTATQVITVQDTKAPVLSAAPENTTVECDAVPAPATLTATDNCDAAPVVTYAEVRTAGNCPSNYTLTRTWTATDACGNTSSKTQTITVQDTKAPVLSEAPADATVECDAVPAPATLTATDNCDAAPVVTYTEVRTAGNCPSNYTLTRTWTATDACGNASSKTQTITVQDTKAPVLSAAPADATVECDAVPAPATLTAIDNCDAAPVVVFTESRTNGNSPSNYTLTRTWTATDACGNVSSKTQTITVQDLTKPVITCPGDVTVNCQDNNAPIATGTATATDNCTDVSNIAISFSDASSYNADPLSVQHYNYIIRRTWRATDLSGNFSECVQTIKVQDVTKPVITVVPQNIEKNNDAAVCGATVSFIAQATDNCGPVTITYSQAPGTVFAVGTTTVTITATDVTGNFSTATFTVKVNDTEKPIVKAPGAYSVPNDPGQCSAVISNIGWPITSDNCDVASVTNDHPSNIYPVGTTVVTWIVTDIHGNVTDTAKQLITVIDNELPTISVTNISRNTDNNVCGATIILPAPVISDNCGMPTAVNDHPSNFYPVGTTNVTWTVTDIHGLKATTVQQVTVKDMQLPNVITRNITVNLNTSGTVSISADDINAGSNDACGVASTSLSKTSFNCANVGQNTVTLTVVDVNGNTSSKTAVVTVVDSILPTIVAVPAQVFCANANGSTQYAIPALSSSDNCSVASTSYTITGATTRSGSGSNASGTFNAGMSTITWTVKDVNGNTSTSTTAVKVNTLPVASIASSNADAFCNKVTLTASSTINPASYRWTSNNSNFAGTQSISLDLTNADGVYSVWVTDNNTGCTSAAAANYTYQKENLASNYTILTYKDTKIGKYNKVNSGSVGVMTARYEAEFDSYSSLSGQGAFVKAPSIDKHGFGINLNQQIIGLATVTLPTMQLNTAITKDLPNLNAGTSNVTINGNFKNLTVKKGVSVTVTGNTFGTVKLEEGASIRFTSPVLNIETLQADRGSKNNTYSYIRFAGTTSVRVSSKVAIGSQVWVNPDNNQVTFYMGDLKSDEEKFTVNGGDTKVTANIFMPNGKLKVHATDDDKDDYDGCSHKAHLSILCPHRGHDHNDCDHKAHNEDGCGDDVFMTGLFIAESVESHGNTVIWNSFSCGTAPAVISNNNNLVTSSKTTAETATVATTEDELKVTVLPNPSTTLFTLKLSSRNSTPVNLRVMDANGRTIDARSKLESNSTLQIGQTYSSGTYYAEFTQGGTRKVVQLIKARG